jgi:hypothetical protein
VRKLEAAYYPPDGRTYAYVDVVNFTDYYYPDSYSSEVGVFSSPDGRTAWQYHGIVIPRGPAGSWDGGGIASPGVAVADDGSVIVGYAGENSPSGGINRGIGVAISRHPLGPFAKSKALIADPKGVCGASGRCDDVIMQSRPGGEIHIYHSVKGGAPPPGTGIRHRMSKDSGLTWSKSSLVLSAAQQPGHSPTETIAGKFFPSLFDGKGAMALITDGGPGNALHAYLSASPADMVNFVAATEPSITAHPNVSAAPRKGDWANGQLGFISDKDGNVASVTYALWTGQPVKDRRKNTTILGYTHTVFDLRMKTVAGAPELPPPPPPPPPSPPPRPPSSLSLFHDVIQT